MTKDNLIYISSSCIKNKTVFETVKILADQGIKNIELSGGHVYQENFLNDLVQLKKNYSLNYSIHNYFPPPKENFVLNIASCNDIIFQKTINFYKNTINLCEKLNVSKYGMHGGFLIDPKPKELGSTISNHDLYLKKNSLQQMLSGYKTLNKNKNIKLYFENNVLSKKNLERFKTNPFLLTDTNSFRELKKSIDFNLLLDLAHLKVSCKSLNLNFYDEANSLIKETDYLHISGNDGNHDSNNSIIEDKQLIKVLDKNNLKSKTITLEIYDDLPTIKKKS